MVRVEQIDAADPARADEVRDPEAGHRARQPRELDRRRVRDDVQAERPPGDGDGVEHQALCLVDPLDAREERILEACGPGALLSRLSPLHRVPHELVDEERVPPRLARDSSRHLLPSPRDPFEELLREALRVVRIEAVEPQRPHFAERAEDELGDGSAGRARGRQEEQRGRIGRPEEIAEEGETVGVRPLHIVDDENDRAPAGELAEELAHGPEELPPSLLRVYRHPLGRVACFRERGHPPQDGKRLREERPPPRHRLREPLCRHLREDAAERIDDPVDGLVRHTLALVAPARENDRARLLGRQLREAPHEGRLADARLPQHRDRAGRAAQRLVELVAQDRELEVAPHERPAAGRRRGRRASDSPVTAPVLALRRSRI